METGVSNKW